MLDMKIEIANYKELSKKFKDDANRIGGVTQTIVSKVALLVERQAKFYSPVKTGRMRASIIPINIDQMSATVGPQVEYAKYVHNRIPFMFAAREDVVPQVEGIVKQEVRKALE